MARLPCLQLASTPALDDGCLLDTLTAPADFFHYVLAQHHRLPDVGTKSCSPRFSVAAAILSRREKCQPIIEASRKI